jgi:hypothetical protein
MFNKIVDYGASFLIASCGQAFGEGLWSLCLTAKEWYDNDMFFFQQDKKS